MKVGFYGGAFNPIHRCHLVVAETVQSRIGLDTVLFIPTGDPPHKPPDEFIPAAQRLEMARLAIAGHPSFELCDIETRRRSKSYSIETVRQLRRSYPAGTSLIFIIGLDAFLDLPSWKDPEALLAECDFAVVSRPSHRFASIASLSFLHSEDLPLLQQLDGRQRDTESFRLRTGRTLWALSIPPCEVSSQDVRKRLKHKESIENLLPPSVESYIVKNHILGGR